MNRTPSWPSTPNSELCWWSCAIALPLGLTPPGNSFGWLLGGILGAIVVAALSAIVLLRSRKVNRAAQRYLEALCQFDTADFADEGLAYRLPHVPQGSWRALTDQTLAAMRRHCHRLHEVEHAQAALEIRAARATADSRRLSNVLTGISDPVMALDEFGDLVLTNPSAEEILELEGKADGQRVLAELKRCEKLLHVLTTVSQRKAPGSRTEDIELAGRDGQSHWYRVTATKLAAAEGDAAQSGAAATVAVLRDIGEQKALQKRNAEFVSSVSHEMKTPLAGIKAYVELLADGDAEDDATREEFLEVINSQADRLQRLVENMLNLARIEAGVVKVSKHQQSLNDLLEKAVGVVHPTAEAKHIALAAELSPMYLGVLADADMLLQAAINLLSNAIKYTPEGGRVTVRSRMIDDHVRFEVCDTGVGLSPEDCQKVFEKFYRVNKDKHMASGTGLGLPLAKHIVEDVHGGQLTVESVLGQGSSFIVTLPSAGVMT